MLRPVVLVVLFISSTLTSSNPEVQIWGPGLRPDKILLPARYFFLHIANGTSADDYSTQIIGDGRSGPCRVWTNKLNCKDGHLIFRYRLYETCHNLQIHIKYKNRHIKESPYSFSGPILNEKCNCPKENFELWRTEYECPNQLDRLSADMERFKDVDMEAVAEAAIGRFDKPGSISLCYYEIRANRLFRKCYGQHVGFNIFSDAILLSILRKVKVPDQSFFMNLGDWPLVKKSNTERSIPIFSWCGSDDTEDIVLPTYDLTESTLENMDRVTLDMLSVQGNIDKVWKDKIPQAFWRGRDSRMERLKLIAIAKENPSLFNASLTNFFFFRDEEAVYGPKAPLVSFFKFFDYKYQINIDGTVAAYRFPYLLAGDSVVLKQDSSYYEHFYGDLIPGEHYLPFKRDLSDLKEKILWAIENDKEAEAIGKKGREFARKYLMPKDIICYYALALNEWAKRLANPFAKIENLEEVPMDGGKCDCDNNFKDEL